MGRQLCLYGMPKERADAVLCARMLKLLSALWILLACCGDWLKSQPIRCLTKHSIAHQGVRLPSEQTGVS